MAEEKSKKFPFENSLLRRFLKYVGIWTTSDYQLADEGVQPSTERQLDFAHILEDELKQLCKNVQTTISEYGYVYAKIPPSAGYEKVPSVGFLAHMDTSPDAPGENVKPQIFERDDLKFGFARDTVITSDGSTLLGADDKAGIAEILTALQVILGIDDEGNSLKEIPHGQIEVIFSPDEETGHGMDHVPLDLIESKQCYTVDGGGLGEIEGECFNAYKTEILFTGKSMHTGSGRNGLINAITMASNFIALLPHTQTPETTSEYEGFYVPISFEGDIESTKVTLLLRDFTTEGIEKRKETVQIFANTIKAKFPGSFVGVTHTEQYKNMKMELEKVPYVMENLIQAVKCAGIEPCIKQIRGGTDGSRLTELGIPTPNIFTGGHNFHSKTEWASLTQMCYSVKTIIELIKIYGANGAE
ncbi:MAG: tripeptide aminopeptidase PepT [Treponemataceae bacterium]